MQTPDIQLPKLVDADAADDSRESTRLGRALICHTVDSVYHSWPEVSCSQLKSLRDSSLAFYHRHEIKQSEQASSASLLFGTLLHKWHELSPDVFWKRARVAPEHLCTATGAFGAKTKEWLLENGYMK